MATRRTDIEEYLNLEFPYFLEKYPIKIIQDNYFNPGAPYGNIETMRKEDAWYPDINYLYKNPFPNENVIVFNNRVTNPFIASKLDYFHILRDSDPYYKLLLQELHLVEKNNPSDITYNAKQRYKEAKKRNKGKEVMPLSRFIENEEDGWLRNMFHGGTLEELERDGYYPNIKQMLEWNPHLYEPTRDIYNYLHPTELPEVIITPKHKNGSKLIPKKRFLK